MKNFDNSFLSENIKLIAGIDEAGRGPLAGPVVAAAAVFDSDCIIEGVDDSKKLSAQRREMLYEQITENALSWSVCLVDNREIDRLNILQATLFAMKNALDGLKVRPCLVLIDGNKAFASDTACHTVVGGDAKSFSIAAASIIAKVTRDRLMDRLSEEYPCYRWDKNKGYGTKEHCEAIIKHGVSPYHRETFLRKLRLEHKLYCHPASDESIYGAD